MHSSIGRYTRVVWNPFVVSIRAFKKHARNNSGDAYCRGREVSQQRAVTRNAKPNNPADQPRAAFMVVGNEILSGSIADANTPWLAKFLYARGIDLIRVEYVPDDEDDIGETVLRLRDKVGEDGLVFSSGGIGPTHDDVTYEALAKALGLGISLHQPTHERMKVHYGQRGVELNESRLRMACLPQPCLVLDPPPASWVPLVCAGSNVYILPGIPRLFQSMLENHSDYFSGKGGGKMLSQILYTSLGEGDVASPLADIAAKHTKVRIGSYPNTNWAEDKVDAGGYRVKLVVEGRNQDAVNAAADDIRQAFTLT